MTTLDRRVAALEQSSPKKLGPFFIHFVGLDTKDSEIQRITKGALVWDRQDCESEQDLKNRAIREALPPRPRCSTVFLCI